MAKSSRMALCSGLLVVLLGGGFAYAHKIRIFATVEGTTITGSVFFPGGGKARGATVQVFGPDGARLGEATTDEQGEFTFQTTRQCDHKLVVQTPDGHRAECLVKAAELTGAPVPEAATGPPEAEAATAGEDEPEDKAVGERREPTAPLALSRAELQGVVERAVSKQVNPLREDLDSLKEKRRFQDILGGIGYILGLAGITFYFLGTRKRNAGA